MIASCISYHPIYLATDREDCQAPNQQRALRANDKKNNQRQAFWKKSPTKASNTTIYDRLLTTYLMHEIAVWNQSTGSIIGNILQNEMFMMGNALSVNAAFFKMRKGLAPFFTVQNALPCSYKFTVMIGYLDISLEVFIFKWSWQSTTDKWLDCHCVALRFYVSYHLILFASQMRTSLWMHFSKMELVHPFQYVTYAILLYSSSVQWCWQSWRCLDHCFQYCGIVNKALSGPFFPFLVRQLLSGTVPRPATGGGASLVARAATWAGSLSGRSHHVEGARRKGHGYLICFWTRWKMLCCQKTNFWHIREGGKQIQASDNHDSCTWEGRL